MLNHPEIPPHCIFFIRSKNPDDNNWYFLQIEGKEPIPIDGCIYYWRVIIAAMAVWGWQIEEERLKKEYPVGMFINPEALEIHHEMVVRVMKQIEEWKSWGRGITD